MGHTYKGDMEKHPAGTFIPEIIARMIINVMAEHGLYANAIDVVFEYVKIEILHQKIEPVNVMQGFNYSE